MIAILDNVINVLTLGVGFILGEIIHLLLTPVGPVITLLLVYLEYLVVKSTIRDMRLALNHLRRVYRLKNINGTLINSLMIKGYRLMALLLTIGTYSLSQLFINKRISKSRKIKLLNDI